MPNRTDREPRIGNTGYGLEPHGPSMYNFSMDIPTLSHTLCSDKQPEAYIGVKEAILVPYYPKCKKSKKKKIVKKKKNPEEVLFSILRPGNNVRKMKMAMFSLSAC